jgi:ParB family chromosome partitioning protein
MTTVELSLLDEWTANPRPDADPAHVAELKASILSAAGLLQNLVVAPSKNIPGRWTVLAGNSRHAALKDCLADGLLPADHPVPVEIRDVDTDGADAMLISIAENVIRKPMDPIDECSAMAELVARGKSILITHYPPPK